MSRAGPVGRWLAAAWLLLLFLRAVVVSGVQTMAIILRRACGGPSPRAGLVRMRFAPMSENGRSHVSSLRSASARRRQLISTEQLRSSTQASARTNGTG